MSKIENFLFRRLNFKLEIWHLILAGMFFVLSIIVFGALVEKGATDRRGHWLTHTALNVASIPKDTRKVINYVLTGYKPALAGDQRFDELDGFQRFQDKEDEALMLARYDGDINRSVVEILDLDDGTVLHRYEPDLQEFIDQPSRRDNVKWINKDSNPQNFFMIHPWLMEDGGMVVLGMGAPLARYDVCGNKMWMIDKLFHHALERDADGNFWTGSYRKPTTIEGFPRDWFDDTIIQVSPDGEILFEKSIAELLLDNDLKHLVYLSGSYSADPIHINDVQPALSSGPHWNKGDLFISLRHSSTILLYRPSTDEIVWIQQGPWLMQHDVDIISDHEIAVFDNNAGPMPWGQHVLKANDTIIYDFDNREARSPYRDAYEKNEIETITEGLSEILPDGDIFVEEQNFGRLLRMNEDGDVIWSYVNRASDGRIYLVNWTRYVDKASAMNAVTEAKANSCNPTPG